MTCWLTGSYLLSPQVLVRRGLAAAPGLAKKACCAYIVLVVVTVLLCGILPTAESPLYKAG